MKRTEDFIVFYLKRLLESKTDDKLPLYYSNRFRSILRRINDDVSRTLINSENTDSKKSTKTYIDIDEGSIDKISFVMVNKIKDAMGIDKDDDSSIEANNITDDQFKSVFSSRLRSTMKINRFVTEIFGDLYASKTLTEEEKKYNREHGIKTGAQKLEDFVNKFKSYRAPSEFKLVEGDDIVFWYNGSNYAEDYGSLGNSCMSYDRCSEYINFYAKNKGRVSLLILKDRDDKNKISGRAIVWNLSYPSGRTFMDRIYTNNDFDVDSFKDYAKEKGWLYKQYQDMSSSGRIIDTTTDEEEYMQLIVHGMVDNEYYPYMDTMKYYDVNNETIQNSDHELVNYIFLEDTHGGSDNRSNYNYDELVDMFFNDIMDEFKYYARNYFPDMVWDYVNSGFVENYIEGEIYAYEDSIEDLMDEDDIATYLNDQIDNPIVIEYLKAKADENEEESKELNELSKDELMEIVENLGLRYDMTSDYITDRYRGYSARELLEEMYGSRSVDNLSDDIYYMIENYIDKEDCARAYAESEDESYLRERYQ